jgi:charged multivesicular body protein 2A
MADAMKGVTKTLIKMNKLIDLPSLNKIMAEFMKENERNELMQEVVGDTIDDAMEEEGGVEEEDLIFRQILDEIGAKAADAAPEAPRSDPIKQPTAVEGKPLLDLIS